MPDTKLAEALKLAKTKPQFFAFLLKLPEGKLVVSKTKIAMKDVLQMKKDMGGGTPIMGTCSGPLDDMEFKTGAPVAGVVQNVIPKVVKRDTGLRIVATMVYGKELADEAKDLDDADSKIPPPLPVPDVAVKPGDELNRLLMLADILDSIKPIKGTFSDGAHFSVTMQGRDYEMNQKEVDTNRKNAQAAFAKGVQLVQQRTRNAREEYQEYRSSMTSGVFGTVATFVFEHTSVTDPGDRINALSITANSKSLAALTAAFKNSFKEASVALIEADAAAQRMHALMAAYKAGLEHSAGTTVTVLEGVKTASEITLAVGGAVATGGATLAVAGGTGTAVAGVSAGTVAFAGGMGITAASDLAPALMGDKVDWGKFAFDMALGVVLKKLGPGEAMEKALLEKMGVSAVKKIGESKAKEAVAKVVAGEGEALMKKGIELTQKKLSGKDVTWGEFTDETEKEFAKEGVPSVVKVLKVMLAK